MSVEINWYKFADVLAEKSEAENYEEWTEDVSDERHVLHAIVGQKGMPDAVTKKLKAGGCDDGNTVLLIVDM